MKHHGNNINWGSNNDGYTIINYKIIKLMITIVRSNIKCMVVVTLMATNNSCNGQIVAVAITW
jgi:hypothetical protein